MYWLPSESSERRGSASAERLFAPHARPVRLRKTCARRSSLKPTVVSLFLVLGVAAMMTLLVVNQPHRGTPLKQPSALMSSTR